MLSDALRTSIVLPFFRGGGPIPSPPPLSLSLPLKGSDGFTLVPSLEVAEVTKGIAREHELVPQILA